MNLRKRLVFIGFILMLSFILTSEACESYFNLVIENQTTERLTIYVEGGSLGTVEPGQQVTERDFPGISIKYLIEAKNTQGETVFSERLSRQQMQHIEGSDTYKVVISSSS